MEATKTQAEEAVKLLTQGFMNAEGFASLVREIYQSYAENHTMLEVHSASSGKQASWHLYFLRMMSENIENAIS